MENLESLKTHCRGCGRKVYFLKDEEGKIQILDAVAPVYSYMGQDESGKIKVSRLATGWASHFNTCPKSSLFSSKNKNG